MMEIAKAIKEHFSKIALESYDLTMDRDKSQQYGVERVPAIVLQVEVERRSLFRGS